MLEKFDFTLADKERITNQFVYYSDNDTLGIWESFNAFYNLEAKNIPFWQGANWGDRRKVIYMIEKYKDVFKALMDNSPPVWILRFYDLMQIREHPKYPKLKNGGVISIRNLDEMGAEHSPENGWAIQYYNEPDSLRDFLLSIYIVRCNKVHGDKDPMDDNDNEILKSSSEALKDFLQHIYQL